MAVAELSAALAPDAAEARRRHGARLLLIAPVVILIGVFLVLPYLNIVVMSIRVPSTRAPYAPGFTAGNYLNALGDGLYMGTLLRSLLIAMGTTALCLAIGYPVAYHLARTNSRFKGLLFAAVLSPLLVGVVIRSYGWIIILANNGLVNQALAGLGIPPLPLMYNHFGVMVALVHVFLPFMILPLTGAIQAIDPTLESAARSLGASRRKVFARIVLPLSMPGIQSGTILVFVLAMSAYVTPMLLGGGSVQTMATLVVQQLVDAFLWPVGAALALILSISGGIAVFLYARFTARVMRRLAS
jgi:putative spermidine/putrescine transport system permease protein